MPGWHLAGGVCVPWAVELVDPAGVVGDEDGFLRVDATGTPHLAYANATGLRYATRGAGGWTSELVTPTHASAQLVLDASGGPHLAWAASFAAMYADKASGAWKTSTVEANDVDCDVSLALDASGATLVAYHVLTTNVANTVLHLASGAAGATAWTVETIPNGGPGCYVREAVDSAGALHVLHVSISEMDHLVKSSGSWTLHALSFSSEASEFSGPSFTLPAGGGYGVAYVDNVLDDLQYTYPSGSAQYPVATSTVLDGRYQSPTGGKSLAFDSKGTPWLAYGAGTSLVLARYDGTNWHANPIEDTHDFYFGGVSLVLDANDAPHLAWYTKDGLKYAQ